MPRTRNEPDTVKFTISLSRPAAEILEKLVTTGVYGKSRAETASMIILRHLQDLRTTNKLPD